MKPRLSRPLLTAIVSGALVAGGAVYTSPAQAVAPVAAVPVLAATEEPTTPTTTTPSTTEPTTDAPVPTTPTSTTPTATATATAEPTTDAPTTPPTTEPTTEPTTPPTTEPTATPDTVKPTGTFRLNSGGLWLGQTLVFNQNISEFGDNVTPDNQINRKINWGDGTSTQLYPSWVTVNKRYARNGKFNVTVTLTDKAGNSFTTAPKSVSVTTPAKGTYSLSTKKVYQGVSFGVTVKKLPAGATGFVVDWADGSTSYHAKKSGTVKGYILYKVVNGKETGTRLSGVRTIRVAPVNKFGASLYQYAGKVNVLKDSWKPKLTITKPSSSTKASSWKTVRGTASDKGSGLIRNSVYLTAFRMTQAGAMYCLTPQKKWKRVNTDAQFNSCFVNLVRVPVKKGKWSLTLPKGLSKGYFLVGAVAGDYADRYVERTREVRLTR
ncbi:PKD domain-containing protein [Actinoplanes sp. GCM10030250]|uniref:PKD domain-containing protein n=1 Tax=Actinoplanes sp. GCM10030250 TaxID=3273376 RepID=UPI00361D8574